LDFIGRYNRDTVIPIKFKVDTIEIWTQIYPQNLKAFRIEPLEEYYYIFPDWYYVYIEKIGNRREFKIFLLDCF